MQFRGSARRSRGGDGSACAEARAKGFSHGDRPLDGISLARVDFVSVSLVLVAPLCRQEPTCEKHEMSFDGGRTYVVGLWADSAVV